MYTSGMAHASELPYDQRPANRDLKHLDGEYGLPFVGKTLDMFRDPQGLFALVQTPRWIRRIWRMVAHQH